MIHAHTQSIRTQSHTHRLQLDTLCAWPSCHRLTAHTRPHTHPPTHTHTHTHTHVPATNPPPPQTHRAQLDGLVRLARVPQSQADYTLIHSVRSSVLGFGLAKDSRLAHSYASAASRVVRGGLAGPRSKQQRGTVVEEVSPPPAGFSGCECKVSLVLGMFASIDLCVHTVNRSESFSLP